MRRLAFLLVALFALSIAPPAFASEQQELVDRAKLVVDRLRRDANMGKPINNLLERTKAVLIVPNLWRAGFFFGGSGGSAVLLAKGADGSWSAPAFYGIGGGSFGLQIGAEMQELLLLVLTDGGLAKIMDNQVKMGADMVAYSSSIGLYGGLNLEGSLIAVREEWNRGYYGEGATSREIVFNRRFDNPGAADLKAALAAVPPS